LAKESKTPPVLEKHRKSMGSKKKAIATAIAIAIG